MTYGHLRADCLYTGISSGPSAWYRVWEAFTFFTCELYRGHRFRACASSYPTGRALRRCLIGNASSCSSERIRRPRCTTRRASNCSRSSAGEGSGRYRRHRRSSRRSVDPCSLLCRSKHGSAGGNCREMINSREFPQVPYTSHGIPTGTGMY